MGVDDESQEDADLLVGHFVDAFEDELHLGASCKVFLEFDPIAAAIALFEAVLVAHAFLEDVHELVQQDTKLLVLGLLAERKLVHEGLGRLLVLLPQLGVEVQLIALLYLHNYYTHPSEIKCGEF
jgi:hypothetical protein